MAVKIAGKEDYCALSLTKEKKINEKIKRGTIDLQGYFCLLLDCQMLKDFAYMLMPEERKSMVDLKKNSKNETVLLRPEKVIIYCGHSLSKKASLIRQWCVFLFLSKKK